MVKERRIDLGVDPENMGWPRLVLILPYSEELAECEIGDVICPISRMKIGLDSDAKPPSFVLWGKEMVALTDIDRRVLDLAGYKNLEDALARLGNGTDTAGDKKLVLGIIAKDQLNKMTDDTPIYLVDGSRRIIDAVTDARLSALFRRASCDMQVM